MKDMSRKKIADYTHTHTMVNHHHHIIYMKTPKLHIGKLQISMYSYCLHQDLEICRSYE